MKSNKRAFSFIFSFMIYLGIFAMGIVGGMLLQQSITQSTMMKVAGSLDGVQIDVNFNETLMVNAMMDNFEEIGLFNYINETKDVFYTKGDEE